MHKQLVRSVFLAGLSLFFSASLSAQTPWADTLPLSKSISILNKKLFLQFPATAVNSPRVADIMAADPNENKETRIISDNGKMRLVFFAQDLFSLGGNTLYEDISKQVEPDFDFTRRKIMDSASLLAVLSTPSLFDSSQNAILVNSLLVQSPDNTVTRIDAYINPDAWNEKEEYVRLTERIFNTLSKGTRSIVLNAHTETYKIPGTSKQFTFELPANYFVTLDEKYDFSVFKINKFKKLTDDQYTSLTIYTGHHPTFFHKEYGLTDSTALRVKASFLQQSYDWLLFNAEKDKFYLREQIIPASAIEAGLVFHVALLSNKKEIMEELNTITGKIKIQ
ncbi:MAG: hypothetical protein NTW29_22220 [Bacteroidetes bacterium]|nr:hypothetical protein [Bacteroidota bacterium]